MVGQQAVAIDQSLQDKLNQIKAVEGVITGVQSQVATIEQAVRDNASANQIHDEREAMLAVNSADPRPGCG